MSRPAYDPWWKAAVVYQVYPRSFADSDGDGVGDLRGLIDRLDHIAGLGCDVVWLSPVYRSPQDDNGYDISDYQDVDPAFGTLADLDELVEELHRRGMRLLMDLVVNHTSDEHPWFRQSRRDRTNPKADWYLWREPRDGLPGGTPGAEPNNWGSVFSGPAWEWVPERGQYYLHLFSRKQPDLNWANPEVRAAVFAMMRWWLDRGVDGFRMDVVNLLSKPDGLPDAPVHGPTGLGAGFDLCVHGPRLEEHLAEMKREVFESRPGTYLLVGETPGATPEQGLRLTDRETGTLSMVFQFEHVDLDHEGSKWRHRPLPLVDLKRSLGRWQAAMGERGWNSLYLSNHDQPRPVSRFGNDRVDGDRPFWRESATALATVLHLQRGTPFVYQGEELGMRNVPFSSVTDFRDIESLNHYRTAVEGGADPETVLADLRRMSRDNARTPVQWSSGPHAGFTTGTPWLGVNPDHTWLNAEAQVGDPASVYRYYRELVSLRHRVRAVVEGDFTMLEPDHPRLFAYRRRLEDAWIEVWANLSDAPLDVDLSAVRRRGVLLLANLPARAIAPESAGTLAPWEARVYGTR